MKIIVGIPARMNSSRFPKKPLCDILGKPMIQHVYERCKSKYINSFVATCDKEIYDKIVSIGGKCIMTSKDINRPGLRIAEACKELNLDDNDIVVVVQGDEPLIYPSMIEEATKPLIYSWDREDIMCTHLVTEATQEELDDINEVKAIANNTMDAMFFSRASIPSNARTNDMPRLKQVCIFAFRYKNMKEFYNLKPTPLEIAESIEMMRAIEHNKLIRLVKTKHKTKSVDTEKDRKEVERIMKEDLKMNNRIMQQNHFKLKDGEKIFTCKQCLTLSTRPRVEFNEDGVCNACQWVEKKKSKIDWDERWRELKKICDKYRRDDGYWDVIVPYSGGKDSAYIAWKLKYELNMNPLLVTLRVPYLTEIGRKNMERLIENGFDHILISPNQKIYRKICKKGFIELGRPKFAFAMGIQTAVFKIATSFNIPFLVYGEEGEEEYGGSTSQIGKFKISRDYLVNYYYGGHDPENIMKEYPSEEINWWKLPSQKELDAIDMYPIHWSHFEDWDAKGHYLYLKDKYDFITPDNNQIGTFINYAQLDDKIQDLHAYMMFIKFGFGRAWSDACIGIRAGEITREEGIELVKKHDGEFPYEYLSDYLEFFDMTGEEFWNTIDSFRSPDIWEKVDDEWRLKFDIE